LTPTSLTPPPSQRAPTFPRRRGAHRSVSRPSSRIDEAGPPGFEPGVEAPEAPVVSQLYYGAAPPPPADRSGLTPAPKKPPRPPGSRPGALESGMGEPPVHFAPEQSGGWSGARTPSGPVSSRLDGDPGSQAPDVSDIPGIGRASLGWVAQPPRAGSTDAPNSG